jgi:hypothetical protein
MSVRTRCFLVLIALLIALLPLPARAQTPDAQPPGPAPDPARPPLNPFPAEQNWSFLADSSKSTDFFDPVKYISFGDNPQLYLSLGFEYRIQYEYYPWISGAEPQNHSGYALNRVMPHFDFHAGSDFRLFSEFEFDYEDGRIGGPRPQIDEDRGDVHQAFLEIGPHVSSPHGMSLRAGRQEVVLGSGRLFDNNEGPNVKLSFDEVRAIAEGAHVRVDLFALKPVENNLGWFDDVPNHAQTVWGSYLTVPAPIINRGQADIYYIGLDTKSATYNRGTAHELRHTGGARVFRPIGKGLDYNWQLNYQWGSFGAASIRAWSVSTETGFTFDRIRFHPRPVLRADVYSGDGNPANRPLGTFNTLFPRGAYFTPRGRAFPGASEPDRCASGGSIPVADERHGGFCMGLVLEGINARRDLWFWERSADGSSQYQPCPLSRQSGRSRDSLVPSATYRPCIQPCRLRARIFFQNGELQRRARRRECRLYISILETQGKAREGHSFSVRLLIGIVWNNFGAFEGEDWFPNTPKRRLNNDLWI